MNKNKIKNWVLSEAKKVDINTPASVHFDMLDESAKGFSLIDLSISILEFSVQCLEDKVHDIMPLIIIPLESTIGMSIAIPKFDSIGEHIEPPSLYLLRRDVAKYREQCEEYKTPLFDERISGKTQVYCYYRCFRNMNEIVENWEYNRCIYLEYHPQELILN